MRVLIVGGGGREHALAHAISKSRKIERIYCIPGNAGIAELAECSNIDITDNKKVKEYAVDKRIDLVVIGPELPLISGIVDELQSEGIRVFGPNERAAILEGSKVFSKALMKKYDIPTANYEVFYSKQDAIDYLKSTSYPCVVKVDGIASGKGVLICNDYEEAVSAVILIMENMEFGVAGNSIVIEEYIQGPEVSILALADGERVIPLESAMDHKRIGDNDTGLNTGGMGAISPNPYYTEEIDSICHRKIFEPTIRAMKLEDREYIGIIFFGLMLTKSGPKVLEYNARFGDPEAQVVIPRIENDIVDLMEACIDGKLQDVELKFDNRSSACVILSSEGYPKEYQTGKVILGLDDDIWNRDDVVCYHSGTEFKGDDVVSSGGRIIGITALGDSMADAIEKAYMASDKIRFEGAYKRSDIGRKAINLTK